MRRYCKPAMENMTRLPRRQAIIAGTASRTVLPGSTHTAVKSSPRPPRRWMLAPVSRRNLPRICREVSFRVARKRMSKVTAVRRSSAYSAGCPAGSSPFSSVRKESQHCRASPSQPAHSVNHGKIRLWKGCFIRTSGSLEIRRKSRIFRLLFIIPMHKGNFQ